MQVGVSLIDTQNKRVLLRGGGADIADHLTMRQAAENCSEICYYGMMFGGLWNPWYTLPNYIGNDIAHYLKCTEPSTAGPLNGMRLQHASQFNTLNLDPTVPKMNVTDSKACMRM